MKKIFILLFLSVIATFSAQAQRKTDKLDRGVVAVPYGTGYLVSWRVMGEEYYDVTYNLYRDGSLIATGLSASNYNDVSGTSSSQYQVAPVVKGVEKERSAVATPWANGYKSIPMATPTDRNGADASQYYSLNDVTLGDLNGDGVTEFIVKRPCSDANNPSQKVRFNQLDCYDINGNRLWWIDLGPNMIAGPDEQWDCVAFDWDQDGKAEVLLRMADDGIIHFADGTTQRIGTAGVDTRYNGIEYTYTGAEYLVYLEGATGKPYQVMDYPLTRGADADWGSGIIGHRSSKHYFGAPFLDGRKASIFLGRGAYTMHKMAAYDVDPATHALTRRWYWECKDKNSPWFGQGYHNYAIGDVDWDGKDEIIFGSMVIDDNGKGLSTTGLGHGDSQHCSDFDPYRKYSEQFACNEDNPAMNYRNAATAQLYKRTTAGGDDGRALMGNFTNDYPGSVGRTVSTDKMLSSVSDKFISELSAQSFIPWAKLNSRIYWDGDLLDEYMDGNGNENVPADIYKPGDNRIIRFEGTALTNSTKRNFCAQGDIFGDWREELVLRSSDNTELRVYTTNYPTQYRIPTLWHDHQYRNAMVWQSMGYNQTPHKSYFLGELEGITQAPPPLTMTGRRELKSQDNIPTTDEHLIICEPYNSFLYVPAAGASPYIMTFNVPSNVEGTAESNTTVKETTIKYEDISCSVSGGPFTGATRIVKQGGGILYLQNTTMTYTGNTDIWEGSVYFDGTMQNSPVWLNRHTSLFSRNATYASLKMEYGSTFDIEGVVTVNTLEMHEGARIKIDKDMGESINITDFIVRKQNWQYGPKYLAPVFEVESDVELTSGSKTQIGTVSGTVTGDLSSVVVETNVPLGLQGKLLVEDGKLYVVVDYDENLYKRVGQVKTIYERGYETAWTDADVDGEDEIVTTYGVYKTGQDYSNAATISLPTPTAGSTIAVEAYWVGMSDVNRYFYQGNYSYFKYGSILLMENDQDNKVAYSIDGGATYKEFGGNSTWANRNYDISAKNWMVVQIEIETSTNHLNYLRVYSSNDLNNPLVNVVNVDLNDNFDYTNAAIGYKRSGSTTTTNQEYLQKIKVTEAAYTNVYAGAQYRVNFKDETGATLKPSETRMGIHGNPIELTEEDVEDIYSEDGAYKWVKASDNAGVLAADGSTVVNVVFNKLYKYTVKAVSGGTPITNIQTGYVDDDETIPVYYDHGMMVDGKVYMVNSSSYVKNVTKSNLNPTITYTLYEDVKYYTEVEDATTTREYGRRTNDAACSGGVAVGVYKDARTYGTAVDGGIYTLTVNGFYRTSGDQNYSVRISNDNENFQEVGTIKFTNSATGEQTLTGIEIPSGYFVDLFNTIGNNAKNHLDYFYLTKTGDLEVEEPEEPASGDIVTIPSSFALTSSSIPFDGGNIVTGTKVTALTAGNGNTITAYFDTDNVAGTRTPYHLGANEEVTVSFNAYHGWLDKGGPCTVSLLNSDGVELAAYTYTTASCNVTDVKIGGATVAGFEAFACQSKYTNGNANGFTGGSKAQCYQTADGHNPVVTMTVHQNGYVTFNIKCTAQGIDKTFTAQLSDVKIDLAKITLKSNANNGDRELAINNLVLTKKTVVRTSGTVVGQTNYSSAYNSDKSPEYPLGDGEKYHFVFRNYSDMQANYHNWVLFATDGATTNHFALRNDNWDNISSSNNGCVSEFNWDTFKSDMNGSTVDMYVTYSKDNSVVMTSTITTTEGKVYHYSYTYNGNTLDDDEVTLYFTTEKSYIDIIVAEKMQNIIDAMLVLEPKAADNYVNGTYTSVKVNRTFKAGYSTLCVPFRTNVAEFTNEDSEAYVAYFSGVTTENGATILEFTNGTEIYANKPYIIYVSKELVAPTVTNKRVYSETPETITVGDWSMTGNYTVNKSMFNLYGVANNFAIMKGSSTATLNGLAAFITGPANASVKSRIMENEADAVLGVDAEGAIVTGIYNVSGAPVKSIQRGINIIRMSDGTSRKVFIK